MAGIRLGYAVLLTRGSDNMALADFVDEVASHQFSDLLHFYSTQPLVVTGSVARGILESPAALDRTLTASELTWLGDLVAGLNAGDFTVRDFEAAARLMEAGWITQSQFLTVLGM